MQFFVKGKPVSQGSLKVIRGRAIHVKDRELKLWRGTIAAIARGTGFPLAKGGVEIELTFLLERPKTVTRSEPYVRPDLDKLIRAVLDALTGVLYDDDQQIVRIRAQKAYGDVQGVFIAISESEYTSRTTKDFDVSPIEEIKTNK